MGQGYGSWRLLRTRGGGEGKGDAADLEKVKVFRLELAVSYVAETLKSFRLLGGFVAGNER